ncbi:histidine phosphatase family protein [Paraburkholderia sp. B3]|uniref:histidine phosphatase family protein n=1 Tax=Paraburkholderia sp. B3 TaxID=3134791 RepID=UPI00398222D2
MKRSRIWLARMASSLALVSACAHAADNSTPTATTAAATVATNNLETLVFVRHGEKPAAGLGQLSCKGLNRALALPAVIAAKYGKPDAIYAPDPGEQKNDSGKPYYYVRPLATIEPTAIQFGLPVETPYGYSQIDKLGNALVDPKWRDRTVLVAWEHREIETLVRQIVVAHGGDAADVPKWKSADFDSIYVLRIDWSSAAPRVRFTREREGLDGRSNDCPCATLPGTQ